MFGSDLFLPKPSSEASQDISHVVNSVFKDEFTEKPLDLDQISHLEVSKFGDVPYNRKYIGKLTDACTEKEQRLAGADSVEKMMVKAQIRAMSADKRAERQRARSIELNIPTNKSNFRNCLDVEALRKFKLLVPTDFRRERPLRAPIPAPPAIPNYQKDISNQKFRKKSERLPKITKKQHSHLPDVCQLEDSYAYQEDDDDAMVEIEPKASYSHRKPKRVISSAKKSHGDHSLKWATKVKPCDFVCEPQVLIFSDYEANKSYERSFEIRNISQKSSGFRLLPPRTSYFSLVKGTYPGGDYGGVAPGMSVKFVIKFSPDSLADFHDEMSLILEDKSVKIVPVKGLRLPPILNLQNSTDIGECLVGDTKIVSVELINDGGDAKFCIFSDRHEPCFDFFKLVNRMDSAVLTMDPFRIYPAVLDLKAGKKETLTVEFSPTTNGSFEQNLYFVCDNCQVYAYSMQARGSFLDVQLQNVEGDEWLPECGDFVDGEAEHRILFETCNPGNQLARFIKVKNPHRIPLECNWLIVKPNPVVFGSEESPLSMETRIKDQKSGFDVYPSDLVIPPEGVVDFKLTFAAPKAGRYNVVCQLIAKDVPQVSIPLQQLNVPLDMDHLQKRLDYNMIDIELKAECIPYALTLYPCAIVYPGLVPLSTPMKRMFLLQNDSISAVEFEWRILDDTETGSIVEVVPAVGYIQPGDEVEFIVTITTPRPGDVDVFVECSINSCQVICLPVKATVMGPTIETETASIDFGLVRLGTLQTKSLKLINQSHFAIDFEVSDKVQIVTDDNEKGDNDRPPPYAANLLVSQQQGTIPALSHMEVNVCVSGQKNGILKGYLDVSTPNGNSCHVAVTGRIQSPLVSLMKSNLAVDRAFLGVAIESTVTLVNHTLLATSFNWGPPEGEDCSQCDILIRPQTGTIGPKQSLDITFTITGKTIGMFSDILLPCDIQEMDQPVALAISLQVFGLSVSFKVSDVDPKFVDVDPSDILDEGNQELQIDFGDNVPLNASIVRYLTIENLSDIEAQFALDFETFGVTPVSNRRDVVKYSFRKPKENEIQKLASESNKGLALLATPAGGTLKGFETTTVQLEAYGDMWGTYYDSLCIRIGSDLHRIPTEVTLFGTPLKFLMTGGRSDIKAITRFGPLLRTNGITKRPTKVYNSSPFDLRLDWQLYSITESDKQLVDCVMSIGDPFPVNGSQEAKPTSTSNVDHSARIQNIDIIRSQRIPLIRTFLRQHQGIRDEDGPFQVTPKQMVIPARGGAPISVLFNTSFESDLEGFHGFALGFVSLDDEKVRCGNDGKTNRIDKYDVPPVKFEMTADLRSACLEIVRDEDESLSLCSSVSDVISGSLKKIQLQFCNRKEMQIEFYAQVKWPFFISKLNRNVKIAKTDDGHSKTGNILLKQNRTLQFRVSFLVCESDLISILNSNQEIGENPSDLPQGVSVCSVNGERRVNFKEELSILFINGEQQTIPVEAFVYLPSIRTETTELNFDVTLIGRTEKRSILLTNFARCPTNWNCSFICNDDDVFSVTPSEGVLGDSTDKFERNKVYADVTFAPNACKEYNGIIQFRGDFGTQPFVVKLTGSASFDEKYDSQMAYQAMDDKVIV